MDSRVNINHQAKKDKAENLAKKREEQSVTRIEQVRVQSAVRLH